MRAVDHFYNIFVYDKSSEREIWEQGKSGSMDFQSKL